MRAKSENEIIIALKKKIIRLRKKENIYNFL